MKHFLEIDSINKSFDNRKILTDVYLKCETGEIVGVFGRNGSGKSTLLKIIYGTESADNKFVKLNNKVLDVAYKEKNGWCFLPQDKYIPNHFTVKKTIELCIEKNKLESFNNDVDIQIILKSKIDVLSGGELRYLSVKLLLFSESKFCLLDEPYSGLSPIYIEKINNLIKQKSTEKGIIITDHNYQDLLNISTKIFLIKDGFGRFLKDKSELVSNGY